MTARRKKIFKRVMLAVAITLVVILAGGVIVGYAMLRGGLPRTAGEIEVDGLECKVTIYRDEQGRPHVYAGSKGDLLFGQGYAHAQDRLWQMELHRRAGQGRISEIIGASELDTDILMRRAGLPRIAERLKSNSTAETVALLESYAAGVNAYLENMRGVPPEFRLLGFRPEPWDVDDVFGVAALMVFTSNHTWRDEMLRFRLEEALEKELFLDMIPPVYPETDVPAVWTRERALAYRGEKLNAPAELLSLENSRYFPDLGFGSNSWAVSPERSVTGKALFAFDSHDSLDVPNLYYENRLVLEGELELYGWSAPGMAGMVDGFNNYVAWGLTNIGDIQDLFLHERHPENPHLFRYDDEWYEAEVYTEIINVSGWEEPKELEVIVTRHGPLLSEDPPISLKWTVYYSEEGFDALLEMNFARSWEEFREGMNKFTMPSTNVTYADVEGNIASRPMGLYPIRRKGSGNLISPGWSSEYGWDGFIPMEELPELLNPPDGYVAAANALPAREDYPYIISVDNATGYRIRRITQVLTEDKKFTLEEMKQLQTDWYNAHAERRLPGLLELLEKHRAQMSRVEADAVEVLKQWSANPVNAREEAGPVIFEGWYLHLIEEIFKEELEKELYRDFLNRRYLVYENVERFLERSESPWLKGDMEGVILTAFQNAVSEAADKLGDNPSSWRWDQLQSISFNHAVGSALGPLSGIFNRGPYPFGGGNMTVGRGQYSLNRPFVVSHIPSIRVVAELGREITAYGSIPMGQSGHPLSPHYDDQIETWMAGEYYPLSFGEVPGDKAVKLTLIPR